MGPISSPDELRAMSLEQLRALADEIRQKIISACLKNGGHLGASLGAVEIALALHYVFRSPGEPIVWDVGHQAYAHKLLTGRWDRFDTLRTQGGISGFLSRDESPHDVFGAGHSSTALSAALAMAWARARGSGARRDWTVAVVGDGGLTAGVAFEALNNVRAQELGPLLVVLNDNQMSISKNVGAVPWVLASNQAKELFGLFGFEVVGPLDGHDLGTLIGTLRGIRESGGEKPVLMHVITQKGKGYTPAEESPAAYHGVSPVQEKVSGKPAAPKQKTYSDAFGEALCGLAERDDRIVAITAAMPEGTGLSGFARRFPERFFDVGIAEPHAVTFAAGLATQGYRPVVAIYSTFLQRALDAVIHDVALQRLGVVFAIDRAGVVGADGPTHHGAFDLAYLGAVPGLRISAPSCLEDLESVLGDAISSGGPWAIRYPRGGGPATLGLAADEAGVRWHRRAPSATLVVAALGAAVSRALEAACSVDSTGARVSVLSTIHAKPLPETLLAACGGKRVLTVEDGAERGGFGEALLGELARREGRADLAGYSDRFIAHGTPASLEAAEGASPDALARRMRALLEGAGAP